MVLPHSGIAGRRAGRGKTPAGHGGGDAEIPRFSSPRTMRWASCRFYGGEFETALAHLERGIELYDPRHTARPVRPRSASTWIRACPARSTPPGHSGCSGIRRARSRGCRRRSSWPTRSIIHSAWPTAYRFAAAFHQSRRERDASHEQAERSVALSTEHGFGAVLMAANFHRGWVLARTGARRGRPGARCERGWQPAGRFGRNACSRATWHGWPRCMATSGDLGKDWIWCDEALATGTRIGESLLDGRAVSVARSAHGHGEGRRVVFRRGDRDRAATAREVVRAPGRDEPEPAVGPPREDAGSPRAAGRGLCLVHRRV